MKNTFRTVVALALVVICGAAWAGNTYPCKGTRHKGDDKPASFNIDVTGVNSVEQAEKAARLGEQLHGWTVDSLTCSEPVVATAVYFCAVEGTCAVRKSSPDEQDKVVSHDWWGKVDDNGLGKRHAEVLAHAYWASDARSKKFCDRDFKSTSIACEK